MQLGAAGIWTTQLDNFPAAQAQEAVAELEELGFGALWCGESTGREALTNAGLLLAATKRIGVSHVPLVEQLRGHRYDKPVATMRAYLDAMDKAPYRAAPPSPKPLRVLAALGPKMLQLSAERSDGAHPYNTTPKHTAQARELLGPGPYLCPEQAVVLDKDPAKARAIARKFLAIYLTLPNYTNNFLRLGFQEADFSNGGSDKLIDAVIAWGDLKSVLNRIREHHSAGADHVCIQVLTDDPKTLPFREYRELASAIRGN